MIAMELFFLTQSGVQKYLEQPGGQEAVNSYAYIVMEDLLDCFSRISAATRGDTLTVIHIYRLGIF